MMRWRRIPLWVVVAAVVPLLYLFILIWALVAGGVDAARTVIEETREWQRLLQW